LPWHLPEWLPNNVTQVVQTFLRLPDEVIFSVPIGVPPTRAQEAGTLEGGLWADESLRRIFERLTTDLRMRDAWAELDQAPLAYPSDNAEPERRQEFLHAYLTMAVWPGVPASYWGTVPTVAKQRRQLREISALARKLQTLLGPHLQPQPARFRHTGWQILNAGLEVGNLSEALRGKLSRLQNESPRVGGGPFLPPFISLSAAFATLPEMLDALDETAAFASRQSLPKPANRTTRKGNPTRSVVFMCRRLNALLGLYLTRACHDAVAATVTVALDLPTPLAADDVRKYLTPRHKKVRSRANGKKSKKSVQ
jgi:hypothetical protein